jgi:hypothetical protein
MLRKTVIALMATAAVAMLVPDLASAQTGGPPIAVLNEGISGAHVPAIVWVLMPWLVSIETY